MGFRDLTTLRRRYAGQAGQLVHEFYVPVLGQATRYDRQAGYFDSATLGQLASGLDAFIRRVRDLPRADRPALQQFSALINYDLPYLGIDPTEEVVVTFSGALADRHPPTAPGEGDQGVDIKGKTGVRFLTWGDPYLTAWLEAMRGAPLTEADYNTAGLTPGATPS
jgi:hypothetical protein